MLRRRRPHQVFRPLRFQPRLERLEDRTVPTAFWGSFAGTAQHTAQAPVTSAPLNQILWQTDVDLHPQYSGGDLLIHYGSPLLTQANTLIVPVKTGTADGFRVEGHSGTTGSLQWTETTDYTLPSHGWTPSYSPVLTSAGRLYYAGAGGTVYYIDNVDGTPTAPVQLAYYGIDNYNADPSAYNSKVYIDTPLTADSDGNIFFGVRVTGSNPSSLVSGIARISASGTGTWVSAASAAGDSGIGVVPHNCAPALSNDGSTLYMGVRSASTEYYGYLVALDSTTLATQHKVFLKDPRSNFLRNAGLLDDSTASPLVGPDGDVYYGIFGNPYNGSRGFLAHFSADLSETKTFGGFGWDSTPALVPASMVPTYTGTSDYLLFEKYNNYVIANGDGGDGVNQIAILDPNDTMTDPHSSSNGLDVMNAVMIIAGPTPDTSFNSTYRNAVREWCINTALVDPATKSVVMPSEDGKLYRWDLTTNSFTQVVTVNSTGIGEAYVPTLEGPDGTIYTIENAKLFAVGGLAGGLSVAVTSSIPDHAVFGQVVTFTATVSSSDGVTPTGSVAFKDGSTTLATVSLDDSGNATYTTSALSAAKHFITASYSGDHGAGTMVLVQPVLQTTTVTVSANPNPSVHGQSVTFTATVAAGGSTANVPEGIVTFMDGDTVLATRTLNALGMASSNGRVTFPTSALATGSHSITVVYSGDTNFDGSTSTAVTQVVNPASTATALSSSVNPSAYGQQVTFTVTVTTRAPGTGTPTGDVTFWDGGTAVGTGTLDASGKATFTTSDLMAGSHSMTVDYNGGTDFAASTSTAVTQVVNPASTRAALSSSVNPSTYGQEVTFTVTVTTLAPGSGTPTGDVTFWDGTTPLGTGTLDESGKATLTTSDLRAGSHSITVGYNGSVDFAASTSSAVTQVVNRAPTATALESSVNPSAFGQDVTFTATVTTSDPGAGTPTGVVTFLDGSTVLGTRTLDGNGQATITTSELDVGNHSITAVYGDDDNFMGSTSSDFTQIIA
jgi:hypothetical protein